MKRETMPWMYRFEPPSTSMVMVAVFPTMVVADKLVLPERMNKLNLNSSEIPSEPSSPSSSKSLAPKGVSMVKKPPD